MKTESTSSSRSLALAMPLVPGALGNLDAYITAVNRIPLLTAEEETELAKQLHENNDLEAARQLVLSHLRLVVSIARQYIGYGLPHGDLIQEGNIGLMKAVKRFDPARGVRLVSFAIYWIKAEIHEYVLRNWRLVKIATTKAQRKLFFNLRSMKPSLQTLTPNEIDRMAKELNVKPDEVMNMEMRLSGQDIPLESQCEDGEECFSPSAYLAAPNAEPTAQLEALEYDHLQTTGLQNALAALDPRSRKIIESRWLSDQNSVTLHDLAHEFGVSAERIRQIETKALQKMKTALMNA